MLRDQVAKREHSVGPFFLYIILDISVDEFGCVGGDQTFRRLACVGISAQDNLRFCHRWKVDG